MKKLLEIIKRNKNNYIIFIFIIIIDQITKILSINNDITIISNIIKINYIENTGAILGMFEKNIVLIINIIVIIGILIYWKRTKKSNIRNIAFILIISGSVGNLIDRVFRGYVIDFIKFMFIDKLPIFNLADISIVIGFVVLIILNIKIFLERKIK